MLSMIYARSLNHCIGNAGGIPWHLPEDFAHFKKTTMGCPIIMGRKTYEDHLSALPGRLNIVVTQQSGYKAKEGILVVSSIEKAIAEAEADNKTVFIIGGVTFFSMGYEICDCVYETVIDAEIQGDTYLPAFDYSEWKTELLQEHAIDERHRFAFKVYKHQRPSI